MLFLRSFFDTLSRDGHEARVQSCFCMNLSSHSHTPFVHHLLTHPWWPIYILICSLNSASLYVPDSRLYQTMEHFPIKQMYKKYINNIEYYMYGSYSTQIPRTHDLYTSWTHSTQKCQCLLFTAPVFYYIFYTCNEHICRQIEAGGVHAVSCI